MEIVTREEYYKVNDTLVKLLKYMSGENVIVYEIDGKFDLTLEEILNRGKKISEKEFIEKLPEINTNS